MTSILLSGPAGGNKTGVARDILADSTEPVVLIDFQQIYASLLGIQRLPSGRFPERLESDAYALALTEYARLSMIRGAVTQEVDAIVTNSDGNQQRRAYLLSLLPPGAIERVVDPGLAVVRQRLSVDGVLSQQCQEAANRWFLRI